MSSELGREVRGDVVGWNATIKGCGELGREERAIGFADEMLRIGINPDAALFLQILHMISLIPSLKTRMVKHMIRLSKGFSRMNGQFPIHLFACIFDVVVLAFQLMHLLSGNGIMGIGQGCSLLDFYDATCKYVDLVWKLLNFLST